MRVGTAHIEQAKEVTKTCWALSKLSLGHGPTMDALAEQVEAEHSRANDAQVLQCLHTSQDLFALLRAHARDPRCSVCLDAGGHFLGREKVSL